MSVKLEVGEILEIARTHPSLEAFFVASPRLACKMFKQLIERTDLFTSANRKKSGPYAKKRCNRLEERNEDIVDLAEEVDSEGCYIYSHAEIGAKFDLHQNQISKICLDYGVRRHSEREGLQQAA